MRGILEAILKELYVDTAYIYRDILHSLDLTIFSTIFLSENSYYHTRFIPFLARAQWIFSNHGWLCCSISWMAADTNWKERLVIFKIILFDHSYFLFPNLNTNWTSVIVLKKWLFSLPCLEVLTVLCSHLNRKMLLWWGRESLQMLHSVDSYWLWYVPASHISIGHQNPSFGAIFTKLRLNCS